jgi:L-alanine-DL-glutamate epimerase-like enolase superfamily enzyme
VTPHPIPIKHGSADVLDRPGLGIEVDEDRVRHHRVHIATQPAAS